MLKEKNPVLVDQGKGFKGQSPEVVKLGTTKTSWNNFNEMAEMIDRKLDHL